MEAAFHGLDVKGVPVYTLVMSYAHCKHQRHLWIVASSPLTPGIIDDDLLHAAVGRWGRVAAAVERERARPEDAITPRIRACVCRLVRISSGPLVSSSVVELAVSAKLLSSAVLEPSSRGAGSVL